MRSSKDIKGFLSEAPSAKLVEESSKKIDVARTEDKDGQEIPYFKDITFHEIEAELAQRSPSSADVMARVGLFANPSATIGPMVERSLSSLMIQLQHQGQRRLRSIRTVAAGVDPIGFLHLERLKFTPIGYVRGELVYSLPMLPSETVRLTHREWSKTENEYTQLIATSLESATEDKLSEKSELAESFSTQQQHSSAFNASASVSGSYGPINVSANAGYNASSTETNSRQGSVQHVQEVTRAASSRTKQEHKVDFRVSTQYEIEDKSYRELHNNTDHPVRWDFYRLMRKWQIDLYRYDIRLTYDFVIPEPGSYLLRKYIELDELETKLTKPNPFNESPAGISRQNWESLSARYKVSLDPPPDPYFTASAHGEKVFSQRNVGWDYVEIQLPESYEIDSYSARGSSIVEDGGNHSSRGYIDPLDNENSTLLEGGAKRGHRYLWRYYFDWSERSTAETGTVLSIAVRVVGRLTDIAFKAWQTRCYERLVDAAKAIYEEGCE